ALGLARADESHLTGLLNDLPDRPLDMLPILRLRELVEVETMVNGDCDRHWCCRLGHHWARRHEQRRDGVLFLFADAFHHLPLVPHDGIDIIGPGWRGRKSILWGRGWGVGFLGGWRLFRTSGRWWRADSGLAQSVQVSVAGGAFQWSDLGRLH